MAEVEVKFEREDLEGIVAKGSYLIDVNRRFGIRFAEACDVGAGIHHCSVTVTSGAKILSSETKAESEYFAANDRAPNERLACQAKIERAGEIVIMTKEKAQEPKADDKPSEDWHEQYRKEFADMPLEAKIKNLVQLETIALSETVSYIINSPFTIADKIMDVMAEFGFRKEEQQKTSARPEEHKSDKSNGASNGKQEAAKAQAPEA
jgi:ferredoxin